MSRLRTTRSDKPSKTPEREELEAQLQRLHNRLSALTDSIFFNKRNVEKYESFKKTAESLRDRQGFTVPIPTEEELGETIWREEAELKDLKREYQALERQLLSGPLSVVR